MKQKIRKEGKDLVMELRMPLMATRSNPYDETEKDPMDNICGIIAGDEIGFAHWIDMDYKDKDDQVSVPFYLYQGEADEFKKICGELKIQIVEYPLCTKCSRVIYGTHEWNGGAVCYECGEKKVV